MASIRDVAKAAGVSVSTVSRTINNNPTITEETKNKVNKAIKELNYVPNIMAKSLSNSNSYTITLLVDTDEENLYFNPFFYEVMHGIEKVVYDKEYCLIVANLNTLLHKEGVLDWLVQGKRTEGVILPSTIVNSKIVKELSKNSIPFVSIGEPVNINESITWVDINNRKAAMQAVNQLVENGNRKISFIGLDENKLFSRRRFEGYKESLESNGVEYINDLVFKCSSTKKDGYRITKKLIENDNLPDAIICADSLISVGVLQALNERGISTPENIEIIGFENTQIAELMYPELTTIDVNVFDLGVKAGKMLFELIDDPESQGQEVLISTKIENRETTK